MLGRKHDRRRAEDRVDARGEHTNLLVAVLHREIDVGAFAAADPVALALEDLFRPARFDLLDVLDQLFRVFSDAQEPLLEISLLDRGAATPANAARRLFI